MNLKRIFIVIFIFLLSCSSQLSKKEALLKEIKNTSGRNLNDYTFDESTSFVSRVAKESDKGFSYIKVLDEKPDYTLYQPTPQEIRQIEKSFQELPQFTKSILEKRLVKIYFINDFITSGLTEFILDENNEFYYIMAFHPSILKKNINQWLTEKEYTCFKKDNSNLTLEIKVNEKVSSFYGILLHESIHALDYSNQLTPYVEPAISVIRETQITKTDITEGIWLEYKKPLKEYDFNERNKITFYGSNKGPLLSLIDAPEIYRNLMLTPFTSLYSTLMWSEDVADYLMFYHLTEKMKYPYLILLYKDKKEIYRFEPMKNQKVMNRNKSFEKLYQS